MKFYLRITRSQQELILAAPKPAPAPAPAATTATSSPSLASQLFAKMSAAISPNRKPVDDTKLAAAVSLPPLSLTPPAAATTTSAATTSTASISSSNGGGASTSAAGSGSASASVVGGSSNATAAAAALLNGLPPPPKYRTIIPIDINPNQTVSILKELVERETGVSCEEQTIVYRGVSLSDHTRIADTKIAAGAFVVAVVNEPSQPPPGNGPAALATNADQKSKSTASSSSASNKSAGANAAVAPGGRPRMTVEEVAAQIQRLITPRLLQPLMEMGFSQPHAIKALLLNLLNTELAAEWLFVHSEDPDLDEPIDAAILFQIAQSFGLMLEPPPVPAPVLKAIEEGLCTYTATRQHYAPQSYYHCFDCRLVDGRGCCVACAKNCHAGHRISAPIHSDSFFCDCGSGDGPTPCKSLVKPKVSPTANTTATAPATATATATAPAATAASTNSTPAPIASASAVSASSSGATTTSSSSSSSSPQKERDVKEPVSVRPLDDPKALLRRKRLLTRVQPQNLFDFMQRRDYFRLEVNVDSLKRHLAASASAIRDGIPSADIPLLTSLVANLDAFQRQSPSALIATAGPTTAPQPASSPLSPAQKPTSPLPAGSPPHVTVTPPPAASTTVGSPLATSVPAAPIVISDAQLKAAERLLLSPTLRDASAQFAMELFIVLITHPIAIRYFVEAGDADAGAQQHHITGGDIVNSMLQLAMTAYPSLAAISPDAQYQFLCFCVNLTSTPDAIAIAMPNCQNMLSSLPALAVSRSNEPPEVLPIPTRQVMQRLLSNLSLLVATPGAVPPPSASNPIVAGGRYNRLHDLIDQLLSTLRTETEPDLYRDATATLATLISEAGVPARTYCYEVGAKGTLEVLLSRSDKEAAHYAYCSIKLLSDR